MKNLRLVACLCLLTLAAYAQEQTPPPEFTDLPNIHPVLPVPETALVPATPPLPIPAPPPPPAQPPPNPEQLKEAEAERNWAVNALKAKQEDAARASESSQQATPLPGFENQDELARALDPLTDLRTSTSSDRTTPGQLGTFQPVLSPPTSVTNPEAVVPEVNPSAMANPLTTTPSGPVRPLVGPPPTPEMTLPSHGRSQPPTPNTVKLSSDPNFIPEGYVDPLTRLQQEQAAASQRTTQALANSRPEPRRPTYRDLRQRIPDPTDRPPF